MHIQTVVCVHTIKEEKYLGEGLEWVGETEPVQSMLVSSGR